MDEKQFAELNNKLDIIITLLAQDLIQDKDTIRGKIQFLSECGLQTGEISKIVNKSRDNIRAQLSELKKKSSKKKKS